MDAVGRQTVAVGIRIEAVAADGCTSVAGGNGPPVETLSSVSACCKVARMVKGQGSGPSSGTGCCTSPLI